MPGMASALAVLRCAIGGNWLRVKSALILATLLVGLLGTGTAPAAASPFAETRVGASTPVVVNIVGPHESISAGQRWGPAPPQAETVVATGVAANGAGDLAGPLTKAESEGLQASLNPNKLNHIFGKAEHNFDPLIQRFGSQQAVVEQMYRGLQGVVPSGGRFTVTRTIGGESVVIDGAVVNGVPRIGTAYIP